MFEGKMSDLRFFTKSLKFLPKFTQEYYIQNIKKWGPKSHNTNVDIVLIFQLSVFYFDTNNHNLVLLRHLLIIGCKPAMLNWPMVYCDNCDNTDYFLLLCQ